MQQPNKKLKLEEEEDDRFYESGMDRKLGEIWDIVDAGENIPTIDAPTFKKMMLKFDKAVVRNQDARSKYADEPLKFEDSELDLVEEIKNITSLSETPQLYKLLTPHVSSILALLQHENTDVLIAATALLNEWTDEELMTDATQDARDGMEILIKSLEENGIITSLVGSLARLNHLDGDDKQGIFNILNIIENMISVDPMMAEKVGSQTWLLSWCATRIQDQDFDSIKQYAAEILAILIQESKGNRLHFLKDSGFDGLLGVLARYRNRDPESDDEIEMMENLFNIICALLAEKEAKTAFLEGEGIELMILMLKEKKMSKIRAIKVVDHALLTPYGHPLAHRFIENFGLKTLFPIFMKKGIKAYKKEYKGFSERQEEEHVMSIILSLFKHADTIDSQLRLLKKFLELEKIDRLVELHSQYMDAMNDLKISFIDGEDEDQMYLDRLEAGLFTLQMVDLIMLNCIALERPETTIKDHILMMLARRNENIDSVKKVVKEYADNLGEGAPEEPNYDKYNAYELLKVV